MNYALKVNLIFNFFKKILLCIYESVVDTVKHDGVEHAGYLSFLALLSFFPFLVFYIAIAGLFGATELGDHFVQIILTNMPDAAAKVLAPRVDEIISGPPQSLLTIAIVGVVWTASSAVEGLRTIFNRAYRVSTPPSYLFRRFLSIMQFCIMTFLIITAISILIIFPIIAKYVESNLGIDLYSYRKFTVFLPSLMLFIAISIIYFVVPNLKQKWRNVFPGAFLVLVAWTVVGKFFSLHLQSFNQVNLIYGSLASVIITLLFFYIMAMILIFGAEFNYRVEKITGFKFKEKE